MENASVCRLCATEEGIKLNIFTSGRDYMSMIHKYLPIMVHEQDPLPKQICHRCAFRLQDFQEFRDQTARVDASFKRGKWALQQQKKSWPSQPQQSVPGWIPPATNTEVPCVQIKQEGTVSGIPPVLTPQTTVIQQQQPAIQPMSQTIHHQGMIQHHPLMQQTYQQQQQAQIMPQEQRQLMLQQQLQLIPQPQQQMIQQPQQQMIQQPQQQMIQQPQQQLIPQLQQQLISHQQTQLRQQKQPQLTQQQETQLIQQPYAPVLHRPPVMRSTQPRAQVHFNQNRVEMNSPARNDTRITRQQSSNEVYLKSGENHDFLPEEPDGGMSDSSNDNRYQDSLEPYQFDAHRSSSGGKISPQDTRKRKRSSSDPTYKYRKRSRGPRKPKSNAKATKKPKSNTGSVVNVNNVKQPAKPKSKPGPKCSKPTEFGGRKISESDLSHKSAVNASLEKIKVEHSEQKEKVRKPGPKSKVGIRNDEESDNDPDVTVVMYKPPNCVLDTIDMTEEADSPAESEDDIDDANMPPDILLTKIPGGFCVYTCTLCESNSTSRKRVINHACPRKQTKSEPPVTLEIDVEKSETKVSSTKEADKPKEAEEGQTGLYTCDICDMTFARHVSLVAHKENHLLSLINSDSESSDSLESVKRNKKKNVSATNNVAPSPCLE